MQQPIPQAAPAGAQGGQGSVDAALLLQAAAQSVQHIAAQSSFLNNPSQPTDLTGKEPALDASAQIQQQLAALQNQPPPAATTAKTASKVSFQSIPGSRAFGGKKQVF